MGIPYHPGIKATVDGMATHVLSLQGQSQTNTVKAQDYGNSVRGPARCFACGLFMPLRTSINSSAYCKTLQKLRRALQNKRRGMLSKGQCKASHFSNDSGLIESFGWEVLDYIPCSPDLAPSDFHLFRYLKHCLSGKRFSDNEEVKAAENS
ncbi:uncharacterized protein TNCV_317501 [Trichonephila clavipes]|nr:uncharacterized protein TNCV_317501 [Trichonephila clavipes]